MNPFENIEDLILRYLEGNATDAECKQLKEVFAKDKDARKLFEQTARTWQYGKYSSKWSKIDMQKAWNNMLKKARKKRQGAIFRWGMAASFILLMGISLFFLHKREAPTLTANIPDTTQNQVQLVLSSGEKIAIANHSGKFLNEQGTLIQNDSALLSYTTSGVYSGNQVTYNTLIVPRGCEYRIRLADSTMVILNAESRLTYPTAFTGASREVVLEGEGYFDVTPDKEHPFIVKTPAIQVEVLGTSFNVSAYREETSNKVTLVQGKVNVYSEAGEKELTPNQQFTYNLENRQINIKTVNIEPYTAWISGTLVFDGTPLEEVTQKLARWYDVEFVFMSEEMEGIRFSGRFKKYEKLPYILSLISETTEVQLKLKDKTIVVY